MRPPDPGLDQQTEHRFVSDQFRSAIWRNEAREPAGQGKWLKIQRPDGKLDVRLDLPPLDLPRHTLQQREQAIVFAQDSQYRTRGVDIQRLKLAQREQSGHRVGFGGGDHDRMYGGMKRSAAGPQLRRGFDLESEVGGCVQQRPGGAVFADRDLSLRAGCGLRRFPSANSWHC